MRIQCPLPVTNSNAPSCAIGLQRIHAQCWRVFGICGCTYISFYTLGQTQHAITKGNLINQAYQLDGERGGEVRVGKGYVFMCRDTFTPNNGPASEQAFLCRWPLLWYLRMNAMLCNVHASLMCVNEYVTTRVARVCYMCLPLSL